MDPAAEQHIAVLDLHVSQLAPVTHPPGPGLALTDLSATDLATTLGDLYYALGRKQQRTVVCIELEFPWFLEGRETPPARARFRAQLVAMASQEFDELTRTVLSLARTMRSLGVDSDDAPGSSATATTGPAPDVEVVREINSWLKACESPPLSPDIILLAGACSGGPADRTKFPGDLTASVDLHPESTGDRTITGALCCGTYCGSDVAVKMLPNTGAWIHVRILSDYTRSWHSLKHPNVAPYLGHVAPEGRLGIVRPWISENALIYIRHNVHADRLSMLVRIAEALAYLHGCVPTPVVHGNIKPNNVLVSSDAVVIADYGVNSLLERLGMWPELSLSLSADDCRYMAPELFEPHASRTPASDVFAFAVLCTELYALRPPFPHLRHPHEIVAAISKGERPHIPKECEPALRTLLDDCWYRQPALRPHMSEVRDRLQRMLMRREAKCLCKDTPPPSPQLNALGLRGLPPI